MRFRFEGASIAMTIPQVSPYMNHIRGQYIQPTLERIFYRGEPVTLFDEAQRQANTRLREQLQQKGWGARGGTARA